MEKKKKSQLSWRGGIRTRVHTIRRGVLATNHNHWTMARTLAEQEFMGTINAWSLYRCVVPTIVRQLAMGQRKRK